MISLQRSSTRRAGQAALEQYYSSLFQKVQRQCGTEDVQVGVTSASRGEGVSTVSANLAVAAAKRTDKPTLFVDANLANSSARKLFGLSRTIGLADILSGAATPECIQTTVVDGLSVITAGSETSCRNTTISANAIQLLLDGLSEKFSNIIVDLPPPTASPDCNTIGPLLQGALLVVAAEQIRKQVVSKTNQQLQDAGVNVFGVVFNKRRNHVPNWLYRRL